MHTLKFIYFPVRFSLKCCFNFFRLCSQDLDRQHA